MGERISKQFEHEYYHEGDESEGDPGLSDEQLERMLLPDTLLPNTIKLQDGQLVFTLDHTPAAVADLQHWQYDTFKAHWRDRTIEDAFVTFALKPDGAINHFTMVAVSPLADFSFDYQDLYFTPQQK